MKDLEVVELCLKERVIPTGQQQDGGLCHVRTLGTVHLLPEGVSLTVARPVIVKTNIRNGSIVCLDYWEAASSPCDELGRDAFKAFKMHGVSPPQC